MSNSVPRVPHVADVRALFVGRDFLGLGGYEHVVSGQTQLLRRFDAVINVSSVIRIVAVRPEGEFGSRRFRSPEEGHARNSIRRVYFDSDIILYRSANDPHRPLLAPELFVIITDSLGKVGEIRDDVDRFGRDVNEIIRIAIHEELNVIYLHLVTYP